MATITVNCATEGVAEARTIKSRADSYVQLAEITFTMSGTYDQDASESVEITNAATLIQNSRRNGKTVTLIGACPGQSTMYAGTVYLFKTASLSSTTVDATIFTAAGDEYTDDTALPTFAQQMSVIVAFTEA